MLRLLLAYSLSTILLVFQVNPSNAGSISISKLSITLKTDGSAETFRVENRDSYATSVQILPIAWGQEHENLDPVSEIIAMPPIFDLPPGGQQTVRLAARRLNYQKSEKAFVLVVKEIPTEVLEESGNLAFALNIKLPLFVTPENAKPEPNWQLRKSEDGETELTLTNEGDSHISLSSIALSSLADGSAISSIDKGGYILAGQQRSWPIDANLDQVKGPLNLEAETSIGPIQTVIPLPKS